MTTRTSADNGDAVNAAFDEVYTEPRRLAARQMRREPVRRNSIQSNRRNGTTFQLLGAVRECGCEKMVSPEGIEPSFVESANWLMAHDFWSQVLEPLRVSHSPLFDPSQRV